MTLLRILVVESDDSTRHNLCARLADMGMQALGIPNGAQLARVLPDGPFDIALCSTPLAGESAFSVIARLGLVCANAGLVMLAATPQRDERVVALSLGVDYYLAMPDDWHEFEILLRNLHRRISGKINVEATAPATTPSSAPSHGPDSGAWIFDMAQWTLGVPGGGSVSLTQAEHLILGLLLARPGELITRAQLLSVLNRPQLHVFSRNLDMLISRLRRKVAQQGNERLPVVAERGIGYVFTGRGRLVGEVPTKSLRLS